MPRADEYAGAAELLMTRATDTMFPDNEADYLLAARCVRAMAALASGEVSVARSHFTAEWGAHLRNPRGQIHVAADPLDAEAGDA